MKYIFATTLLLLSQINGMEDFKELASNKPSNHQKYKRIVTVIPRYGKESLIIQRLEIKFQDKWLEACPKRIEFTKEQKEMLIRNAKNRHSLSALALCHHAPFIIRNTPNLLDELQHVFKTDINFQKNSVHDPNYVAARIALRKINTPLDPIDMEDLNVFSLSIEEKLRNGKNVRPVVRIIEAINDMDIADSLYKQNKIRGHPRFQKNVLGALRIIYDMVGESGDFKAKGYIQLFRKENSDSNKMINSIFETKLETKDQEMLNWILNG